MSRIRVAVVGAGAGGLCAAKHFLAAASRYDVSVFEQTSEVGGTWVYREENGASANGKFVHSSMYANLRTNLAKEIMAYPDYQFPSHLPSFVSHRDVHKYLQDYSRHFNIHQRINFDTTVVDVAPVADAEHAAAACDADVAGKRADGSALEWLGPRWQVTHRSAVDERAPAKTELFDSVMICNGHYFQPLCPSIPGMEHFRGAHFHSHDYRRPEAFSDQVVVVAGCGASGQDICLDLASTAKHVMLSASPDKWISAWLPSNIERRPRIERVNADGNVVFADGDVRQVDSILWCTGYGYSFPFLNRRCGMAVHDQRYIQPMYKHIVNAMYPSMMFIGMPYTILPNQVMDIQVKYTKAVLDGQHDLPTTEEMIAWQDRDYEKRLAEGLRSHEAHLMAQRQFEYVMDLAECAGIPPIPAHIRAIYEYIMDGRARNLTRYRQQNFHIRHDVQTAPGVSASDLFEVVPASNTAADKQTASE
ncbi:uncharacterized protein LOC135828747 isoform X1 [Sycon ciliatum]|uniref:uncharacterized protein LOC135828747 isoform X1 n=2 Tax=Sycon ciliatum TaxID=27933 RepID=UPI0031F6B1DA